MAVFLCWSTVWHSSLRVKLEVVVLIPKELDVIG
jgi:hypothetical protein